MSGSKQLSAVLPMWEELINTPRDIERQDVALLNLLAASGLPGAEKLDIPVLLEKLDEWAHIVKLHTASHMHRFAWMRLHPQTDLTVGDSLARYCCYCMLEALQLKCGVRYNPKRKFSPNFCEPADVFIHGILGENGEGGTCASMPVVYVAIGERLGYPVFLNHTKGHLYFCWRSEVETRVEWDSPPYSMLVPQDRFNVEGTGEGIAFFPDAHYIQWPAMLEAKDFEQNTYLRPQTQPENLAAFLVERAYFLLDAGRNAEALNSMFNARRLCPDDERYKAVHSQMTTRCIDAELETFDRIQEMQEHRRQQKNQPKMPWDHIQAQNREIQRRQDRDCLRKRLLDQCRTDPVAKLTFAKEE